MVVCVEHIIHVFSTTDLSTRFKMLHFYYNVNIMAKSVAFNRTVYMIVSSLFIQTDRVGMIVHTNTH